MGVARRRLIARRLRPTAIAGVLVCAAAVTVLGARYAGVSAPGDVDRVVDPRLIDSLGRHRQLAEDLVNIGSPVSVAVLTVLLVAVLLYLRRPRGAVLAAIAAPVASLITEWVLKPIVERTRGGSLSYPSGHTTGIFAVAAVVAVLALDRTRPRLPAVVRVAIAVLALAIATTVAAASIAVGDHYATDTIGGACVAVGTVLLVCLIVDAVADARAAMSSGH
jgi:membrane-associated phospholipid phosphatase